MNLPTRTFFNQLVRRDPFADMDDLLRGFAPAISKQYERTLEMRLDVNEDDDSYFVNVDMPGVKKEDIDVSIDGNQVTIRAEVKRELSQGKGKEIHSERYSGEAYRSFALPAEIDSGKAKAAYDGGVLSLTLPKKAETSAKHLSVN